MKIQNVSITCKRLPLPLTSPALPPPAAKGHCSPVCSGSLSQTFVAFTSGKDGYKSQGKENFGGYLEIPSSAYVIQKY